MRLLEPIGQILKARKIQQGLTQGFELGDRQPLDLPDRRFRQHPHLPRQQPQHQLQLAFLTAFLTALLNSFENSFFLPACCKLHNLLLLY
jgi:hypothetical protein